MAGGFRGLIKTRNIWFTLQSILSRFAIEHCISCYGNRIGEGSEVTEGGEVQYCIVVDSTWQMLDLMTLYLLS